MKSIPLIFDEVTSGLRMTSGGIHLKLGVNPDIAVFAKALGNGYPIAAIIGKKSIMEAAQKSFISSTYWTDRIGPVAGLATLKKHIRCDVGSYLTKIGTRVQNGWRELSRKHGLTIEVTGIPPLSHWEIRHEDNQLLHTIIVERMLKKGFLTSQAFYATYAHKEEQVEKYLEGLDQVFSEIRPYLSNGSLRQIYDGPIAHAGFWRLT